MKPGALEGGYGGVSASATVVAGCRRQCAARWLRQVPSRCKPVSIEGNTGLNVAAGIGALNLKFDRG